MKQTLRNIIRHTLCETPVELTALDEIIKAKQAEIVGLQKQKAAIAKADQAKGQQPTQPVQQQPTQPVQQQQTVPAPQGGQ